MSDPENCDAHLKVTMNGRQARELLEEIEKDIDCRKALEREK